MESSAELLFYNEQYRKCEDIKEVTETLVFSPVYWLCPGHNFITFRINDKYTG